MVGGETALFHEQSRKQRAAQQGNRKESAKHGHRQQTLRREPAGEPLLRDCGRDKDDLSVEKVEMTVALPLGQGETAAQSTHLKPLKKVSQVESIEIPFNHGPPV
jgi:hypothetical protein